MNKIKILFVLLCIMTFSALQAKPKLKSVYMFGFSASFTDSVAYITDIQFVDSVYIDSKTGFLYCRPMYSMQLQSFVDNEYDRPNTTCAIFFSKRKKKMERKYENVRKFYNAKGDVTLKGIDSETFSFISEEYVEPTPEESDEDPNGNGTKGKKHKKKKKNKQAPMDIDGMKPDGNMPGGMPPGGGMPGGGMPGGMPGGMRM